MSRMLEGRRAFVTGGSGAVGGAVVRVLAREGCHALFSYRSGEKAAAKLQEEVPGARAFRLDVLDGQAGRDLAERVEAEFGPVDILVNNAGSTQVLPFALIEEEDWDAVMDANTKGTFLVTKAFVRGMIRRRRGAVVNVGSLAGMRVLEVPVHYAAAKSAVVGFTLSLAREVSRYGIRVNAVVPGLLDGGVGLNVPEKQREEYKRFCALGRLGRPEEVAEVVAFLASDLASYVNAQAVFVDGGI